MPPADENATEPAADENRSRANVVALIFIVLLFGGAFWLFKSLQQNNDVQNCLASGRRDCIDLTRPDGKTP
jgi:flagellar biogenesis protein FliO